MKSILFIICIALTVLSLAYAEEASATLEIKTNSYKFLAPSEGWKQKSGLYGISTAIFAKESQKKEIEYLDNILVQDFALNGKTREEFEKDFFSKLVKIQGFKLIEKITVKEKNLIKLDYLHNETETPLRTLSYLYFGKGNVYIISCSSLAVFYEKNKKIYEETCESFKLL